MLSHPATITNTESLQEVYIHSPPPYTESSWTQQQILLSFLWKHDVCLLSGYISKYCNYYILFTIIANYYIIVHHINLRQTSIQLINTCFSSKTILSSRSSSAKLKLKTNYKITSQFIMCWKYVTSQSILRNSESRSIFLLKYDAVLLIKMIEIYS